MTNVLWLGDGIAGDDTDGHVDDLARFVAPDTIVTVVEEDPADANYAALRDNLEAAAGDARLRTAARSGSKRCRCRPRSIIDGARLPASYANFYIANGGVRDAGIRLYRRRESDGDTRRLFPGRSVIASPQAIWSGALARSIA